MLENIVNPEYKEFLEQLKVRVRDSRYKAALSVNRELIFLYHHIGSEVLKRQEQHGWGAKIIEQLSKDLKSEFPEMKGFIPQNLKYMRCFAQEYVPMITLIYEISNQQNNSLHFLVTGLYLP